MEWFTIPAKKWQPRGGMYRFDKYFFGIKSSQKYLAKIMNFVAFFLKKFQRNLPSHMLPYGGSQWWIIDNYALKYILNFITQNPSYVDFHKYTFAPDEVFFQTILLNSEDKALLKSICNTSKRFFAWEDSSHPHPQTLTTSHFNNIINSDELFARKFDETVDSKILDLIDEECLLQKEFSNETIF